MCKRRSKAGVPAASMKDLVKGRIHNLLINEMSFLLPQLEDLYNGSHIHKLEAGDHVHKLVCKDGKLP